MKITVVRQLMLFVALIAVLSVGITSVIFHYKSNELFMSETKQKLFGQNKSKVDLIATITEEYRTELERLSANREVNELLNSVPGSANYQNLFSNVNRELTSLVQKKNDSFESAYLVDKRGIGIAASDQHLIGTDFSNQEYNKLSVSGMLVSGETLIPGVTGALVTVFTQPIKQNDQIMGYIVATFHTKSFSKFLGDVKVNNTASSYAELLNSKGTIIFGNEAGMFGKKVEVPEIKTILNRIEQGDKSSGIVVINSQGVNSMVSFGTVPETNWVLVIYENVDEIMAPVTVMNRFSLIIALILIAFSCLLGFVFAKKISRPLNSLTNLVIQTANLDFTTEESLFKKLNKRKDEIGSMSSALYEMGGVLLDMINQLLTSSNSINENARLLHVSAEQVVEHANDNSATTQELSAGLEQSAASAEEISAASEDVKQKMDSIMDKAKNGADISKEITVKASMLKQDALNSNETAQTLYQDVKTKMEAALQQAQTVSKINLLTETILRIAEQTNLLSLNAAIEAARAGEAGRGFSVVADEIRKLAEQSSQTVVDIQKIIELVTTSVDSMTVSSQKLLEYVDRNVKSDYQKFIDVSEQYNHDAVVINYLMEDISVTAEQLDLIVTGITMTIAEVARTINEGASGVQEIAGKTGEIVYRINDVKIAANKNLENAMILKGILNKFKI